MFALAESKLASARLSAENLSKSFGSVTALHKVNLEINPGEITVLIGPSGSGKTTLLRLLSMLEHPDSGVIRVDNREYKFPIHAAADMTPPWPKLTVVFQQLFLWPHLTLRENIELPTKKFKDPIRKRRVEELIELFEMSGFVNRYPNETSLGQRQRAALARALVLDPSYVLLDEITSSLDVEQASIIMEHLKTLRERGIGVLLITHALHFAATTADQIVFMDKGEILETGSRSLIKHPTNERLKRFLAVAQSAS